MNPSAPHNSSLIGLNRDQLGKILEGLQVEPSHLGMRSSQLYHWIYCRGAKDFEHMHNVRRDLRQRLAESYTLNRPDIISEQISKDGTRKWLLRYGSFNPPSASPKVDLDVPPLLEGDISFMAPRAPAEVECVYIPEEDRGTLCVSSQVGCTLNCRFCHTGTQKFVRNLTAAEIIGQVMVARDVLGDFSPSQASLSSEGEKKRQISNIVFMGMGEPLYNLDSVCAAIQIMADGEGLSLSRRRITVSTAGVVPQIAELGTRAKAMLAISLHAVRDDLRNLLVPLNKKYPISDLLEACRSYPGVSNARRITFEYVMLKEVNDTPSDARELIRLLAGIPAKINLIPFNPWPGSPYTCSDRSHIERFSEIIFNAGYASPVRTPRGQDILAACGQLKSATERMRPSRLPTPTPLFS